jgi:hypothetical protein
MGAATTAAKGSSERAQDTCFARIHTTAAAHTLYIYDFVYSQQRRVAPYSDRLRIRKHRNDD